MVPSFDSNSTVARHTEALCQTGFSHQSVLGAPAPGISAGTAMMESEQDEVGRMKEFSQDGEKLDEGWIKENGEDTIDFIDLSCRMFYLLKVVNRMNLNFPYYFNFNIFLKNKLFPINQSMSSKISYFIKHFKINEKVDFNSQFAFAVIEYKTFILKGPFIPQTVGQIRKYYVKHHSEYQCIHHLKQKIKLMKKKKNIKTIYIFTKYSPCFGIKGNLCPCMTQLANFSKEMYDKYNIDVIITFQDIYGATGSIAETIQKMVKLPMSNNDKDSIYIERLINKVKKQYPKSKYKYVLGDKEQKHIKRDIIKKIKKINPCVGIEIKMIFPSNPCSLHEFESFIQQQTNNINRQLKKYNFTKENMKYICSLFHSKCCELVDYKRFIYKKISDYINTIAVALAHKDIKANLNNFTLERIELNF
ncbi:uncharacterized protein LOC127179118 [Labeo rohita]|uniref:uncharacterized protein LOC127179118 n=1 Tax=Labeo rohita TaxID=84645 RepID=UPI0021E20CC5|nr:uncharacterized protein LOC127179118 [Labeo rohita]